MRLIAVIPHTARRTVRRYRVSETVYGEIEGLGTHSVSLRPIAFVCAEASWWGHPSGCQDRAHNAVLRPRATGALTPQRQSGAA
jgi:hypothetical protein